MNARVDIEAMPPQVGAAPALRWLNRFAALGEGFHTPLAPRAVEAPAWAAVSSGCAAELGLPADWWQRPDWRALEVFSGAAVWPGMAPLASVYSGHQFGVWAGQLGDGRALLLGEVETPAGPREVQLKGSGLTPYSRMGDGRAVLRSTIREFLCSEAMHALGIPTTRALCMTASTEPVHREQLETAAVLTRVAPSFIRFGHFEHFCHHRQPERLRRLADFVIDHFYPDCRAAAQPVAALLEAVTRRTATLLAHWQAVGFCHGVMNTDNMSILGLTIDYGPFGMLDAFDPGHVCNHTDHQGRYAYARQPSVAYWNLHALAQALLPLVGDDTDVLRAALAPYETVFANAIQTRLRAKLGLLQARDDDDRLIDDLLRLMASERSDYTITWRSLGRFSTAAQADNAGVRDQFIDRAAFDAWALRYRDRLLGEASVDAERAARMDRCNPKFVLRNHLAELAIRHARDGDFSELLRLHSVLERPYDEQDGAEHYAALPPDWAKHLEVSCSS